MSDDRTKSTWPDAASKGIELLRELGGFFGMILGPSVKDIGGTLSDYAAYIRYRNLISIRDKVEKIHERRRLSGKTILILPRYAIPLIENASIENEESIQEKWAALIANATDPDKKLELKKIFINTLASLEPIDAAILNFLFQDGVDENYSITGDQHLNANTLSSAIGCSGEEVRISLQNLYRQGCIIDSWEQSWENLDKGYSGFRVNNPDSNFRLSHFGFSLMVACSNT